MKLRAVLLVLGLGLLGAAIAYDLRVAAALRSTQRQARDASSAAARLKAQLKALSEGGLPGDSVNPVSLSKAHRNVGANPGRSARLDDPPLPGVRLLLSHDPQLSARYLADYAQVINARFGLEFRRLGLSPDDETQLRGILEDMEAQKLKLARIAADQGVNSDDPSLDAIKKQLMQPDKDALNQLLPPDQVAEVREFSQEGSIVETIQEFAGNAQTPTVSIEQASALLPILEGASQKDAEGDFVSHSVNIPTALAAANSVLSSDQLAIFSALLKKDEADRAIQKAGGS